VNASSNASCSSPRRRAEAHAPLSFWAYSAPDEAGWSFPRRADDVPSPTGVGDCRRGREAIEIGGSDLRGSVGIRDTVNSEIEDVGAFGVATGQPAKVTGIPHPARGRLTVARATRAQIVEIECDERPGCSTSECSW
jgi:hypothetical protein